MAHHTKDLFRTIGPIATNADKNTTHLLNLSNKRSISEGRKKKLNEEPNTP